MSGRDSDSLEPLLRQVAAAPSVAPPIELAAGTMIDGYRIERAIGSGGMGIVYLAGDESLGREVALKLHNRIAESGARRLEREARAMAQLSHPNVVTVHEVGTFRDRVYLVMEYVPGGTLRTWLEARDRGVRTVVDVFLQAGAGLAAAHAAGLVHRDFKPDNILIGADGRVRVADFGLARAAMDDDTVPEPFIDAEAATMSAPGMAGTPAYMAPEQFQGRADARTDQFAFCVSLYEALGGERPHAAPLSGTGPGGQLDFEVEIPTVEGLPRRLTEVLERGLSAAPSDRYPDMHALLHDLRRAVAPPRWRRPALLVAALALAGSAGALVAVRAAGGDSEPCAHTRTALATTWSPDRAASLRRALEGTGAGDLAPAIQRGLDAYAGRWSEARYQACTDTRVEARQTAEQLERRVACLESGRRQLDALVGLLATGDPTLAAVGPTAIAALPDTGHCGNRDYLDSALPLPPASAAAAVEELRAELSSAAAETHLGRFAEARAIAAGALDRATDLAYPPVRAEAHLALGIAADYLDDRDQGLTHLEEAYYTGRASRHDEVAVDAALRLARMHELTEPERATSWLRLAGADIARLGDPDRMRASLMRARASLAQARGDFEAAIAAAREALALYRSSNADPLLIADVQIVLGIALDYGGKPDEGLAAFEQALATQEEVLGAEHPGLGRALDNIGLTLSAAGRTDEAIAIHERALAIAEAHLGPRHTNTAYALLNLGVAYDGANRHRDAIEVYQRSLAIIDEVLGPEHPDAALVHNSLGVAYGSLEKYPEAIEHYRKALAIHRATLPDDHMSLAIATGNLAGAQVAAGHPAEALPVLDEAIALWHRAAPDHVGVSYPLTDEGKAYLALDRPAEAIAPLERALSVREGTEVAEDLIAETRFVLARALWDAGRDRNRARNLAEQAAPVLERTGHADATRAAAWLARHGR